MSLRWADGDWKWVTATQSDGPTPVSDILTATEVPAANEVQCGWGANHTLEGAQDAARTFLAARDEWATVTA